MMQNILKKIGFTGLVFSAALFLSAALAPSGQVPVVEPLQPLPEFIKPNIEQNISRNADNQQTSEQPSETGEETGAPPANNAPVVVPTPEVINQETPAPISQGGQSLLLWVVVLGLVIVLVLVVLGIRYHYKNSNNIQE